MKSNKTIKVKSAIYFYNRSNNNYCVCRMKGFVRKYKSLAPSNSTTLSSFIKISTAVCTNIQALNLLSMRKVLNY